ncbi:hypothetical protein AAVH_20566 [Aphelenchoides avenae]|nr:hypothetical protein AAVH_20566 [Aphelenchus avenae]
MSHQWAAYRRLCKEGFSHFTVNHSKNFVAPDDSNVHTQQFIEDYVTEWLWFHQNRGQSKFEAILRHIAAYWPPGTHMNSLEKLADLKDDKSSDSEEDESDTECNCRGPEYGYCCCKCVDSQGPLEDL